MIAKTRIDPSAQRITKIYKEALNELLDYLVVELANPELDFQKQHDAIARTEKIMNTLKMNMEEQVGKEVTAVFTQVTEQLMEKVVAEGGTPPTVFNPLGKTEYLLDEPKINQIISDTMSDLAAATDKTEMYVKQIIRDTFSENMGKQMAMNLGREQIISEMYEQLSKKGFSKDVISESFVGMVDKSGKRWSLDSYVEMVTKTKLMDADNEANRSAGAVNDYDLAVISSHGATDDCSKWEGCIISMNGKTEGYITFDEVKETNECFHPRCQHHLQPVRDVSLVHDRILKEHNKKIKANKETVRNLNK